jgi:predicted RNA-binding Zn ribbon-like protein
MTRPAAVPPFRTLDPALAVAERLLTAGLSTVVAALPDELLAAARLNTLLAATSPRLTLTRQGWQVIHVGPAGELAVAAGGLAALVAVAGWSRLKCCETCATPFLDRTNGRSRRWCAAHRPHRTPRVSPASARSSRPR